MTSAVMMFDWLTSPTDAQALRALTICSAVLVVSTVLTTVGGLFDLASNHVSRLEKSKRLFQTLIAISLIGQFPSGTLASYYSIRLANTSATELTQAANAAQTTKASAANAIADANTAQKEAGSATSLAQEAAKEVAPLPGEIGRAKAGLASLTNNIAADRQRLP